VRVQHAVEVRRRGGGVLLADGDRVEIEVEAVGVLAAADPNARA